LNSTFRRGRLTRVGVFLNFRRIDYKSRAKNSKLLSFVSRCVTGVAINLRL
jgi:hypothetical protein